jgi:hypothetical protein
MLADIGSQVYGPYMQVVMEFRAKVCEKCEGGRSILKMIHGEKHWLASSRQGSAEALAPNPEELGPGATAAGSVGC